MFSNYLTVVLRNISRNKLFSVINITSLALGIAASLLIYLFIQDERSFDQFHSNKNQIYRFNEVQSFPGTNTQKVALSMSAMGPHLHEDYDEVLNYTRYWGWGNQLYSYEDKQLMIDMTVAVDSTFLEIFDFKLIEGDRQTALDDPNSIVITESTASKFFDDGDAMGKLLDLDGDIFEVKGIIEDVPENSHLQFDVLVSITFRTRGNPDFNDQWGSNFLVTYVVFKEDIDIPKFEAMMPDFLLRHNPPDPGEERTMNDYYKFWFQPLTDVHLTSTDIEHDYHNYRKFNGAYLDVFAIVGLFIILIAAVNFMNLTTARASHRWKEVGIRKSIGAEKKQLFSQFVFESVLYSLIALILALIVDLAFTPWLNDLIGRKLDFTGLISNPLFLLIAIASAVFLGISTGVYPAVYMASFKTVRILKGADLKGNKSIFRSSLVIFQFGLAIAMIISTLLVVQQLYFMKNKDIGFNKDHIVLVDMNGTANENYETLKSELLGNANVLGVTASGQRLGNNFHQWGFKLRSDSIIGLTPSNVNVDYDYLDVYEIKLRDGRGFDRDVTSDNGLAFVINESFARELGVDEPVGMPAGHSWYPDDSLGTIIGVSEDFNFNSLHYKVNTLALVVHPDWGYSELSVKINGDNVQAALNDIETIWTRIVPDWPFQHSFLNDHFNELYRSDQQLYSVITIMAVLAILIACMGLFGLAAITTERKIKEVGIRKALGASEGQIVFQLSRNFVVLVLVAFVLFSPLTYLAVEQWLTSFAYRIDINPAIFLLGVVMALVIAIGTVSYHTIRSARTNPVETLRYE